jgi:hypothetical protein
MSDYKKMRDLIKRKLDECPAPESPTYRDRIAGGIIMGVLSQLEDGKPGAVKDAIAFMESVEGKVPQEIAVAVSRPVVFDKLVEDLD